MNRAVTLVKREYWENRGSFFKAPAIFGGFILLIALCYLILLCTHVIHYQTNGTIDLAANVPPGLTKNIFYAMCMPFMIVTWLVAFYYFLHCLYDDRKDRSLLFWQSMPIANWETVLSKAIAGMVILPICAWICIVVTELLFLIMVTIASAAMGLGDISNLWNPAILIMSWLHILSALFIQALWLFPLFGWCVFCSAYAKKSPFLTAIIPVILVVIIESIFFHHSYLENYVMSRFSRASATWSAFFTDSDPYTSFHMASFHKNLLTHRLPQYHHGFLSLYWSLAIGALLMSIAIYLRYTNFRSEN